jgi:hypothetical protein
MQTAGVVVIKSVEIFTDGSLCFSITNLKTIKQVFFFEKDFKSLLFFKKFTKFGLYQQIFNNFYKLKYCF